MGDKFYIASTILIKEDDKYDLLDTENAFKVDEINDMKLLFLTTDADDELSYYGVSDINKAYYKESLEEVVKDYFHYDFYEYSETVENNITEDLIDRVVFIREHKKKFYIVNFGDIYDTFSVMREIYEDENEDDDIITDIDMDNVDADSIMDEVMRNSVSPNDVAVLSDIIKKQIDKKNHIIMEFTESDINSSDIKNTILDLMNRNTSGTILFVHNVSGLSSAFDFYIDDNEIMFVDDTISYIFPHMMKKCFEKSTKMILVINIDHLIDDVELKENYIFNMYMKNDKYVLENVNINKYKLSFMEQFKSEPLICHYVLCDMKGNQYLTFDDN